MKTLSQYKSEQMKHPRFATAYRELEPEMDIIRAMIDARINSSLNQKELSDRTGIAQTEISHIKN